VTTPKRPDRPTPQRVAPERPTSDPKTPTTQSTRGEDKLDSVRDDATHDDSASADSSRTESEDVDIAVVSDNPGVMHTGSQTVMRDGVQVLTDTPERSDDPLAGVRLARD
jgi:hypothetical protein